MAGLYIAQYNKSMKTISIGQLDQLMDRIVQQNTGTLTPAGLLKIALSFRALDIIAGAVSRIPYAIYKGEMDVTEQETPRYWSDLQYRLCESYLLFNQAYCLKETNAYGANAKWRFLVSPAMTILTDPVTRQLSGFRYDNKPIDNYEKQLLWWWWPNILQEVGPGSGPTDAAIEDAALLKYIVSFAAAYFLSGGTPTNVMQMSGVINDNEQEKIKSFWSALKSGAKKAFGAILLTDKVKFTQIGTNIKDTVAPELYRQSAENVSIAYGIPLSKLLSNAANYATALQDDVAFYTNCAIPIAERMSEVWNERVYEPQGLKYELEPERLEIMQQYELQKAQALSTLVGGPIMTPKQAAEWMGWEYEEQPEKPATVVAQVTPTTSTPEDQAQQDEAIDVEGKIDQRVINERRALKRYARKRLDDGKPFTFKSDIISASDIALVKACKTADEIEAMTFGAYDIGLDVLEALNRAIEKAEELKHA